MHKLQGKQKIEALLRIKKDLIKAKAILEDAGIPSHITCSLKGDIPLSNTRFWNDADKQANP